MNDRDEPLAVHLEALRNALIACIVATVILTPFAYWASPYVINYLIRQCIPENVGSLHYFAPMEVFWTQLNLSLILALFLAYPWNMYQIWKFLLPALYKEEARALKSWLFSSSLLFVGGIAFCIYYILPIIMGFSGSFSTDGIKPIIGLQNFLSLAGWLMLAFGLMFQAPIVVLLSVRFGLTTAKSLREKRPFVIVAILFLSALLTPPDVVSQVLLGVPTWLLFEVGLVIASKIEKPKKDEKAQVESESLE
jgi:sec-independent protein translocase protein TatC